MKADKLNSDLLTFRRLVLKVDTDTYQFACDAVKTCGSRKGYELEI